MTLSSFVARGSEAIGALARSAGVAGKDAHVTQFRSAFNPAGPEWSNDCGAAAALISMRLLGLADPQTPAHTAIRSVRELAGSRGSDPMVLSAIENALSKSGARTRRLGSLDEVLARASDSSPVLLVGDAGHKRAWYPAFDIQDVLRTAQDTRHAVVVRQWDAQRGVALINDPQSALGAIEVQRHQLADFLRDVDGPHVGSLVERA